ncbi:unnamed protein product [Protopolystoma xenopodis]|uniref:Uncharacterized protein n=1 Tax=Protopolystoma xenopodis TaxID=117903 RepID=A0A448X0B6_9PLAT|nr:unnamed protein product [Protopolystoma xenopodis]
MSNASRLSTRSRLQTALANEARAIETEKAAKERIEGMVADREAAVERARSLAEAHYTSLRRRLEAEWNAERDEISKQAEQQLGSTRIPKKQL